MTKTEAKKIRSPEGMRYMTYVVAFKDGETPSPASIGSKIMGGTCSAIAMYDCAEALNVAERALDAIVDAESEPVSVAIDTRETLDQVMSGHEWLNTDLLKDLGDVA